MLIFNRPFQENKENKVLLIKTSIKPSLVHGIGCFTEEKILKEQVIWVFDERIDLRIPDSELPNFPLPVREFLNMYGYSAMYKGQKVVVLCGDHSRHFNHSDSPNLLDTELETIALRDIEIGEELTCDYYSFDMDVDKKW